MSDFPTLEEIDGSIASVRACIYRPASDATPYDWQYHVWSTREDEDEDEDRP